jgi:unsaturated rhamnogalacturonyl hydrolase
MNWRSFTLVCLVLFVLASGVAAQTKPISERAAATAMNALWRDAAKKEDGYPAKWTYDHGLVLKGIERVWLNTGDGEYFNFIKRSMDHFVTDEGTIRTYSLDEYNIDHVLPGRNLLLLYKVTGQEKYRKAAALLREQLKTHPRTNEGGFWHKKIYPYQMWLDGLYMGEPFYAEYAVTFHEDAAFDDIAKQFIFMERHSRDDKTGLLYHAWDESRKQRWANPETGRSPNFWARAMGWYAMALVDTLDYFPQNHRQRAELIAILNRLARAVAKYQEPRSGLWYQVLDKGTAKGNYLESSAACMFVYALAKGVRHGYLPISYIRVAESGYSGIVKEFLRTDANGALKLEGTVSVGGLGGNPYRDGSYEYYLSEKVITNDPKGVGALLLAATEMESAATQSIGKGRTVTLDYYFNNETKKDATGRFAPYHYKWEEMRDSGFSLWANIFHNLGVRTNSLPVAPTAANLRNTDVYIIVDPDTAQETERPNSIDNAHVKTIASWVRRGGVLVLMGNDAGNAEFDRLNELAKQFGIQFNKDSRNRVQGNHYQTGRLTVPSPHPIFHGARNLFLKEVSTLRLSSPARPLLQDSGDTIMAVAKFGRGTVFAVGDPWLYNEYTDGRRLPAEYDNYQAAVDLSRWLVQQTRKR